MERSAGVLLHISSLPNRFGIGSLGREARGFADFLSKAGQRYWQMLPLGPTGFGDSPYQPFSAFAGNPYFIDIDALIEDGLLSEAEAAPSLCGEGAVDYGRLFVQRFDLLRLAFSRGRGRLGSDYESFLAENASWLGDYSLFMALKYRFGMVSFSEWPYELRERQPEALAEYAAALSGEPEFFSYLQYLFFKQWDALKQYSREKNIQIIGDLPIYISPDSSDLWARPELFLLDAERRPSLVSGVPPDGFSKDGQLWGNPLYDWNAHRESGFSWWLDRIAMNARLFDVLRIDHFRGLESFWSVASSADTAANGEWVKGPGMDFIRAVKDSFPTLPIIAEDLGYLTPAVRELVKESGYPGMKVLQFAFDSREESDYLPHNYTPRCVCYTGTHDNTTAREWFTAAAPEDVRLAADYLGLSGSEGLAFGLIRGGMSSVAELFIAQLQDYLDLPGEARMNTPGTTGGNWRWRAGRNDFSDKLADKIMYFTKLYGRYRSSSPYNKGGT